MAKYKGVKWAQLLTLMAAIARTLVSSFAQKEEVASTYATKTELQTAKDAFSVTVSGSTLVFPSGSAAHVENSTLILAD